mmetsp:Transcript_14011/g.25967  ORF Transcript_14011/g.25967 Transcript_14011/m.25967 type:complete len:83 (-) Transcript_14011:1636-1884(-)
MEALMRLAQYRLPAKKTRTVLSSFRSLSVLRSSTSDYFVVVGTLISQGKDWLGTASDLNLNKNKKKEAKSTIAQKVLRRLRV